jgi:hypothetical protein
MTELEKYHDLVIATIDYYLESQVSQIKTENFDSDSYYKKLKIETAEHFRKGRLTKLKQWFRDLTEQQIECRNFDFNKYLTEKTQYEIDIFKSYFERIEKTIEKEKITTDKQFYDLNILLDYFCQTKMDNTKIEKINKLIADYEQRKAKRIKKPNA